MSEIPEHCPYKAGDRVQMHGFAGYHVHQGHHIDDHDVTGFRGVVEGYLGGTILTGTTDDGRTWAQYWGRLDPDGTPCGTDGARCGCCPHPGRGWIGDRVRFGTCQPLQADAERARQAARGMHAWWHDPARWQTKPQSPEDALERAQARGLLFDLEVAS